ncbi:hypothetical protein [Methylibium sp. Pch-M]
MLTRPAKCPPVAPTKAKRWRAPQLPSEAWPGPAPRSRSASIAS